MFFDELPWMDTPKSNFLAAFGQFWNTWASTRPNVKIIVCGSATTWMLSKFIGDKGGLYGRVCRSIWLKPFTLGETEAFIKEIKGIELTRSQILEAYMIFGGIPYYLDMLIKGIPLSKNVDELLFKQGAPLRMEFNFLFRSLFNEAEIYRKVIETLASKMKGMSRQEIADALKLKKADFSQKCSKTSSHATLYESTTLSVKPGRTHNISSPTCFRSSTLNLWHTIVGKTANIGAK